MLQEWRVSILGSIPSELIRALNVFEQKSIVQSEEWCLLDPVAMAIVLNETQIIEEWRYTYNTIDLCGKFMGQKTNKCSSYVTKFRNKYTLMPSMCRNGN